MNFDKSPSFTNLKALPVVQQSSKDPLDHTRSMSFPPNLLSVALADAANLASPPVETGPIWTGKNTNRD